MGDVTRLALRARDGDRVALDRFVRATQADVWRVCAYLGGRGEADDLTQATYLRAWTALPRFRADSSARTWLLSIARRVCADHVRAAARRRRIEPLLERRAPVSPDHAGLTSLELAVAALEPDRRAAFVLTQVIGLSYDEAAATLDCPIGTIRSRVARARADLSEALGGDGELFGSG
jgi:RNA polymerase sigma-70 factor (ECF subfamily)